MRCHNEFSEEEECEDRARGDGEHGVSIDGTAARGPGKRRYEDAAIPELVAHEVQGAMGTFVDELRGFVNVFQQTMAVGDDQKQKEVGRLRDRSVTPMTGWNLRT